MAVQLVYFGEDTSHRVQVLSAAGYQVFRCPSIEDLTTTLAGPARIDAVLMNDADVGPGPEIVACARSVTLAPLVLFHCASSECPTRGFDLLINNLAPPRLWLPELDSLIEKKRATRAGSRPFVAASQRLRGESQLQPAHAPTERNRADLSNPQSGA